MSETWRDEVNAAQRRVEAAEAELDAATAARNDLFKRLHGEGVYAQAVSVATRTEANPRGIHRTHVQRIMTPPKTSSA